MTVSFMPKLECKSKGRCDFINAISCDAHRRRDMLGWQ